MTCTLLARGRTWKAAPAVTHSLRACGHSGCPVGESTGSCWHGEGRGSLCFRISTSDAARGPSSCREPSRVTSPLCICGSFLGCSNKLSQTWGLKQRKPVLSQFWRTRVQNLSHGADGRCWQGRALSSSSRGRPCLVGPILVAASVPWLGAASLQCPDPCWPSHRPLLCGVQSLSPSYKDSGPHRSPRTTPSEGHELNRVCTSFVM